MFSKLKKTLLRPNKSGHRRQSSAKETLRRQSTSASCLSLVSDCCEIDDFEERLADAGDAVDRIKLVVDHFGGPDAVTLMTSFGVQSGVMLGLVAESYPRMRVMYIHTQSATSERDLEYGRRVMRAVGKPEDSLVVAKADVTREEFREGMVAVGYKTSGDDFRAMSQDVFKITPMKRQCADSGIKVLISGARRGQTAMRDGLKFVQSSHGSDPAKVRRCSSQSFGSVHIFHNNKNHISTHSQFLLFILFARPRHTRSSTGPMKNAWST